MTSPIKDDRFSLQNAALSQVTPGDLSPETLVGCVLCFTEARSGLLIPCLSLLLVSSVIRLIVSSQTPNPKRAPVLGMRESQEENLWSIRFFSCEWFLEADSKGPVGRNRGENNNWEMLTCSCLTSKEEHEWSPWSVSSGQG